MLLDLVKQEGGYQDIEVDGQTIYQGWKGCTDRWEIIEPHVIGTVLDIGSHYGYFTVKSAQKGCSVWSMEADPKRAEIQKQVLELNKLNVPLSLMKFNLSTCGALLNSCAMIDTILMLSVAHYMDNLPHILKALSFLTHTLIIEYPSKEETEVAERTRIQETDILSLLKDWNVELIGYGQSPNGGYKRPIYKCTTQFKRTTGTPRPHTIEYNGKFLFDGKLRRYEGYSLDLLDNIIYPTDLPYQAAMVYDKLIKERNGEVTDISTRNVVLGDGLNIIDYTENLRRTIYGMPWDYYVERTLSRNIDFHTKEFTAMMNGTWKAEDWK